MYQALYRKYRPRTFDDVVGQKQVTDTLKSQIINGRTSHAYLFIGVRGTGKTTCAKILSKALNCERPVNGNPCNECDSCTGIESGGVMDVVEIDAASNNGVENVRALREEAVYSPASVKKRVYIIDEVHMLSTAAFNALLKILEEPPGHLVFILATTEVHKVLPTIMSRCQRYSFKRISPEAIENRLLYVAEREGIVLEKDAAALLSRLADGSLRDGLSLLDQCAGSEAVSAGRVLSAMGLAGNFRIAALLEHIIAGNTSGAVLEYENMWRDGKSPATLLGELSALLRDIMMLSVAPRGGRELLSGGFDDKTLNTLSRKLRASEAMEYVSLIQESLGSLRDGRDPKIEAELCIIGLCEPGLLDTPSRLGLRVTKLEKALAEGAAHPMAAPVRLEYKEEEPPAPEEAADLDDGPEEDDEPPFDMPDGLNDSSSPDKDTAYQADEDAFSGEPPPSEPEEAAPELLEAPQGAAPGPEDSRLWPPLYDELKRSMPPFHSAHLSGASAHMEGSQLVIRVRGAFAKTALDKAQPQELIRAAIEKVSGTALPFRIEESASAPGASNRLDELSKFGNVKFE